MQKQVDKSALFSMKTLIIIVLSALLCCGIFFIGMHSAFRKKTELWSAEEVSAVIDPISYVMFRTIAYEVEKGGEVEILNSSHYSSLSFFHPKKFTVREGKIIVWQNFDVLFPKEAEVLKKKFREVLVSASSLYPALDFQFEEVSDLNRLSRELYEIPKEAEASSFVYTWSIPMPEKIPP